MDINKELITIILKNQISDCYPNYKRKIQAVSVLNNLYQNFDETDNILLLSIKHSDIYMERSNIAPKDDLEEFHEALSNQQLEKKIVAERELSDKEIDKLSRETFELSGCNSILMVSYARHSELFYKLQREFCDLKIIDIYDCFLAEGLSFDTDYYKVGERLHDGYGNIFYNKKKFLYVKDEKNKKLYMQRLIFDYILIKDFLNTMKNIELYKAQSYDEDGRYGNFLIDLKQFLDTIKQKLCARTQQDIIMNWVDAIQYDELSKMKFLTKMSGQGVFFKNAYTLSPWTIATYYTLFCKVKMVDKEYFRLRDNKTKFSSENSILLKEIEQQGYCFSVFGTNLKVFGGAERCNKFTVNNDLCPLVQWNAIEKLLKTQQKCFVLIHNLLETHSPYVSGNISEDYRWEDMDPNLAQLEESRAYADEQLEFYAQFLGGVNQKRIYMSDHGKMHKDLTHTFLMIIGNDFKNREYEKLFSYYNFYELIRYIMNPSKYQIETLFSEFVQIQDVDKYADFWHARIIKGGYPFKDIFGYQGVRSKEDIYIRRNDGEEFYYNYAGGGNNLIDEDIYQARIVTLKGEIDSGNIDIYTDDFFKNCRSYYKALEKYKNRIRKQIGLTEKYLAEVLQKVPVNSHIAIRGGYEHTKRMLEIIEKYRQVDYIIDVNSSVSHQVEKYRYLLPSEIKSHKIDMFLISSRKHREEIKCELHEIGITATVIDIYDYLETQGVLCKNPFYGDDILEEEDFD